MMAEKSEFVPSQAIVVTCTNSPSCREQEEKPPQPGHGHGAGAEVEDSANMKHANARLRQHEMCGNIRIIRSIDDYSDYTK